MGEVAEAEANEKEKGLGNGRASKRLSCRANQVRPLLCLPLLPRPSRMSLPKAGRSQAAGEDVTKQTLWRDGRRDRSRGRRQGLAQTAVGGHKPLSLRCERYVARSLIPTNLLVL